MNIIPYNRVLKSSKLTNRDVLQKIQNKLEWHRANSFPDSKDFIGGDVAKDRFELFTKPGGIWRPSFPVVAFGKTESEGQWIIRFTCTGPHLIYAGLSYLLLILASSFFPLVAIPILICSYIIAMYQFNKDIVRLELLVDNELQ